MNDATDANPPTSTDLLRLYRDAKARKQWATIDGDQAKRSKESADAACDTLMAAMKAAGVREVIGPDGSQAVRIETRRDVTIANLDDVIAALTERGATIPTKVDTIELRKIAKAIGDVPGIEPTEVQMLKWPAADPGAK